MPLLFLCGLSVGMLNLQLFYLYILHMNWEKKKSERLSPITLIRSERAGPGPALHRQPFCISNHKQLHRWKRIPQITLTPTHRVINCECSKKKRFHCFLLLKLLYFATVDLPCFTQIKYNNSSSYTSAKLVHTSKPQGSKHILYILYMKFRLLQNSFHYNLRFLNKIHL